MTEDREPDDHQADDDDAQPDDDGDIHAGQSVAARRRKRRTIRVAVAAGVTLALAAAVTFIPLPYLVFSPGTVRATEPRISVEGLSADVGDGEILFTTVLQQQGTPFRVFRAWVDDTIDVQKEEDALGDTSPDEDRAINQQRMNDSKSVAIVLALRTLGYEVDIIEEGVFIEAFFDNLPAKEVFEVGDVIVEVDGTTITNTKTLDEVLVPKPAGTEITVTVARTVDGESRDITRSLTLGANEDDPSHGYMGVEVSTVERLGELPVQMELDSGSVIGPSAGLAWTLGVIDRLTEGDLTGGRRVAVTGTINGDGSVGPIGGLAQKTAAVQRAGAEIFLVPAIPKDAGDEQRDAMEAEVKRARDVAGDDLEIVEVGSLDEALDIVAPAGLPDLVDVA